MIVYENECVGCPPEMGCLGELCQYREVPYFHCDKCGDDAEYQYDGNEYCLDCLLEEIGATKIE